MTTFAQPSSGGEADQGSLFTLSPEVSPASRSATRATNSRKKTPGGSGRPWRKSSPISAPPGSSPRTSRVSSVEDSGTSSGTWPRSGMTRNGIAYPLPPSAPLTDVIESLSWPTPKATDGEKGGRGDLTMKLRTGLDSRRKNWPTPLAHLGRGAGAPSRETALARWESGRRNLDDAVVLWPTPTASDSKGGTGYSATRQGGGNLRTEVGGLPNPEWVEWLMGFPPRWTDSDHWETPLFPRSGNTSDG